MKDEYVVGLLLVLIVLSAIPMLSTGILWCSALLLVMVWSRAFSVKGT
jgi:hypothetical protein